MYVREGLKANASTSTLALLSVMPTPLMSNRLRVLFCSNISQNAEHPTSPNLFPAGHSVPHTNKCQGVQVRAPFK